MDIYEQLSRADEKLAEQQTDNFQEDLYDAMSGVCSNYEGFDLTEIDIVEGILYFIKKFFGEDQTSETDEKEIIIKEALSIEAKNCSVNRVMKLLSNRAASYKK